MTQSFVQAERQMIEEGLDHEYAPISGFPAFTEASAKLALGDNSPAVAGGLVRLLQQDNIQILI